MTQYWLCITNRDNWNVVQQQKIWGVAERHKNSIAKAVPGDQLLFYLVSESVDGQLKESAVGGVAEVVSEVFRDTKRIFKRGTAKKTGEVFPLRVTLSHVRPFKEEILFKPLILTLQFIKNKRKWSGHIQGKAMRLIPEGDFTTIIEAEQ
jgi:predicted RNA-binding protein